MTLLDVAHLCAGYGEGSVLADLSLSIAEHEAVVVLGANGAGKTTLLRALSGVIRATGEIVFDGTRIDGQSPERIVRRGMSMVPQGRGTFADLSVADNLRVGALTRGRSAARAEMDRWYDIFPPLAERRSQKAGLLSGGEQQMLAIARACMSRPRLLLCDEPSLGLAPVITKRLFSVLADLRNEFGMALLVVEQSAELALSIAQRAYVLETGRVVAEGHPDDLLADDALRRAYLGV